MQVAIVNFSEIDKKLFRLEAEFYTSNSLLNIDYFTGEEITDFVQYGTSKELNENQNGFPTLRLNEFDSLFIGKPSKFCEKIDISAFNSLSLKKGDVLICRTNGNPKLVGKSAIVPKDFEYAFASYLFRIRPHYSKILPTTLTIYLNSKIGRAEIEKYLMVSNQANFSPAKFREILVPNFGSKIQEIIDNYVWESFNKYELSKVSYQHAQNLLLTDLGLSDWKPKHQLTFIKNYSDTVQAERIDAEYFQPKYEEIIDAIKAYKGGHSTIRKEFRQNKSTFETDDEKLYQYVEIGSINVSNREITPREVLGANLPANAKRTLNKNDIIVSKVRTYRGAITIVEKDGCVGSGAFTALTEGGRVNKETLLVFLHSKPLLSWSLKPNTGTSYPVIVDDDILNLPIPILPQPKQQEIQKKVTESFELRKQSKQLLENAKRAVEMAIEEDESKAIQWLEAQCSALSARGNITSTQPS